MAEHFGFEAGGYLNTEPRKQANGAYHGGRVRRYRAKVTYAAQANGDTIVLAMIPKGSHFMFGKLVTSVSTATATIAIGIPGTAAKYKAAGAHTTPDVYVEFGPAALSALLGDEPNAADEKVIATIGGAALPASGTLIVDLYFSGN